MFLISSYLDGKNLQSYNNRLFKKEDGSYEIRMASVNRVSEKIVDYQGHRIHVFLNGRIKPRSQVEIMGLFLR